MDFLITVLTQAGALGGEFLSESGKKMLSEQVIITGIVLYSLRGHFKKIEKGLESVAANVSELSEALRNVESSHAERIGKLEKRVSLVEQRTTQRKSDV